MVSCKLQGGLGNQLFQIASTHALALRNNDISGFNLNDCYTPLQGNPSSSYRTNILKDINHVESHTFRNVYFEPTFSYQQIPYSKDLMLQGYFQSEKYFIDHKEEIIKLFNPNLNKKLVLDFIVGIDKQITSIHIRRGDYLKNEKFHKTCSMEYYKQSMNLIGDSVFIFFSDDMDWVKKNFKGDNFLFSPFTEEIDDLTLMSECNNNIIANSSFSWWGAYLNQNENKKVVAPKDWFGVNGPKDTQDIIPKNWVKL